jgi:NADH-quinone oxidoreductase subunit L
LSAHIGVILLSSTLPLWFEYDLARIFLATVGLVTTINGSLLSHIRSDRKGAIANATSATLGLIYIILALGYSKLALFFSFGHATFRIIQILRAPNL